MPCRRFIGLVAILLALASPDVAGSEHKLPHILFVLADDLGYGDPRCYNADSRITTPHMDRLAGEGIRFTDAHSPSGVCTPTRYGILTGRYCWRTRLTRGVTHGYDRLLVETDRLTVPKFLARHGYATAAVGKWHLGLGAADPTDYSKPLKPGPLDVGFGSFYGIPASLDMEPYLFVEDDRAVGALTGHTPAGKSQRQGGGGFWRAGPIAEGFRHEDVMPAVTARAAKVIEAHAAARRDQPLFLYVALPTPHDPWLPTSEFAGKSPAGPRGDAVMQTDGSLGEVLAALERAKMADDTLVIFTSDNGGHWTDADARRWAGHRANGPWRGQKSDIHEAGHRVPLIARWPRRIRPGSSSDQTVCLVDLLATCAVIVGDGVGKLPADAAEDSYDILPALLGRAEAGKPVRGPLVLHSGNGLFALRDGDWKFVDGLGSGGFTPPRNVRPKGGEPAGQLYNLRDDPAEQKNVYAENPQIVARMKALLERYKREGRSRLVD
jgi:arylsulfatase A-like enzyme